MVVYTEVTAKVASSVTMLISGWTITEKVAGIYTLLGDHYGQNKLPQVVVSGTESELVVYGAWKDICQVYDALNILSSAARGPHPVDHMKTEEPFIKPYSANPMTADVVNDTIPALETTKTVNVKSEPVDELPKQEESIEPSTNDNSDQIEGKPEPVYDDPPPQLDDDSNVEDQEDASSGDEFEPPNYAGDMDYGSSDNDEEDIDDKDEDPDFEASGEIDIEEAPTAGAKDKKDYKSLVKNAIEYDDGSYECSLCNTRIKSLRHLKMHTRKAHLTRDIPCSRCKKKFSTKETLNQHMKLKHYGGNFKCDFCDTRFSTKLKLTEHRKEKHLREHIDSMRKSTNTSDYPDNCCPICLLIPKTVDELLDHFRAMHFTTVKLASNKNAPDTFRCSLCNFSCKKARGVRDHMRRLHYEKKHQCPVCNRKFGLQKDLNAHIGDHGTQLTCEYCGKAFKTRAGLTYHVKVLHEGNTALKQKYTPEKKLCMICGSLFPNITALKEHMNKHNNVKPYVCDVCQMGFYSKANLRNHKKNHQEVGSYICDICGKTFKQSSAMTTHRRIHFNERLYKCDVCSASFTQSSSLKRHARIHSGDKPYPCRLCGQAFSDYSILRRHLMGVHKSNDRSLMRKIGVEWDQDGVRLGRPPKQDTLAAPPSDDNPSALNPSDVSMAAPANMHVNLTRQPQESIIMPSTSVNAL